MNATCLSVLLVAIPCSVLAQSSPSHKLTEHVFNAGGRPAQAVTSTSATYRLSVDSIGEPVMGGTLTGFSFRLDSGLAAAYPPPGEVTGLQFLVDGQTLIWSPEPFSTAYSVYSGPLSTLPGGYGTCASARVPGLSAVDATLPGAGSGLFYLVTGVNRLREEGTKGHASSGVERANVSPCP